MNKLALRLIILVLLSAVGIFYFLYSRLNKESELVKYVPESSVSFAHFKTKKIAQDIYRSGGFTLDTISFIKDKFPYFDSIYNPREMGIYLYSDIVIYEDLVDSSHYHCALISLNNTPKFNHFCKKLQRKGILNPVSGTVDSLNCYKSLNDSFYVANKNDILILVFNAYVSDLNKIFEKAGSNIWEKEELKGFDDYDILFAQNRDSDLGQKYFEFLKGNSLLAMNFQDGIFTYYGQTDAPTGEIETGFLQPVLSNESGGSTIFEEEIKTAKPEEHSFGAIFREWLHYQQQNN
jgi:hypothetical protein